MSDPKPFFNSDAIRSLTDSDRLLLITSITNLWTNGEMYGDVCCQDLVTVINAISFRPNYPVFLSYYEDETDYPKNSLIINLPSSLQGCRLLQKLRKIKKCENINDLQSILSTETPDIFIDPKAFELLKEIIL